jgi:hypothetical protein
MELGEALRAMQAVGQRLLEQVPARAVAMLNSRGACLVHVGEFRDSELQALEALASRGLRAAGLLGQLLRSEAIVAPLDGEVVHVTIAGRRLFIMLLLAERRLADAVLGALRAASDELDRIMRQTSLGGPAGAPPSPGGSAPGDAGLPIIELGVTPYVGRRGSN